MTDSTTSGESRRGTGARTGAAAGTSLVKAVFDRAAALAALVVLAPILVLVAILIRVDSAGPALFPQKRYGLDGRVFTIYKFRTMTAAASAGPFLQATTGDSRVTRLGRILRASSVDELPQLFNVLMGDMSLVGPRPHPLALDEEYRALIPDYMDRYAVRPGLTGLAQVSGHRGATPGVAAMAERVALDLAYIDGWTPWLDIRILARTPWICLTGEG